MKETVLELDRFAYGGAAMGRSPDGRAVFVPFGLPGERVRVRLVEEKRGFARAELLKVLEASPHRIDPKCLARGDADRGAANLNDRSFVSARQFVFGFRRDRCSQGTGAAEDTTGDKDDFAVGTAGHATSKTPALRSNQFGTVQRPAIQPIPAPTTFVHQRMPGDLNGRCITQ